MGALLDRGTLTGSDVATLLAAAGAPAGRFYPLPGRGTESQRAAAPAAGAQAWGKRGDPMAWQRIGKSAAERAALDELAALAAHL